MYDLLLPTSIKELKNIFAWNLVLNRSKTLRKSFCEKSLTVEHVLDQVFFVENFLNQIFSVKIPWLWKIYLMKYFAENFLDQIFCAKFLISIFFGKLPRLWKNALIKENYVDCGKIPWLRKHFLSVENSLPWLQKIMKSLRHLFLIQNTNFVDLAFLL